MYVCMYVCLYVCMYVIRMYVCVNTHTHTHTHRYDPATGKPFYINHTAKTTQWDPPTAPPVAAAAAAVQQHQQHLVILKSPLYNNLTLPGTYIGCISKSIYSKRIGALIFRS